MILFLFLISLFTFLTIYLAYFLYLYRHVKKPWKVKVDISFEPEMSILIPAYNEEENIEAKLENIRNVSYPKAKLEVIVADDGSTDGTIQRVQNFMQKYRDLNIKLVRQNPRAGKSAALNKALSVCTKPIVVVSDADTSWPQDILRRAMPYLADPCVGAITGRSANVDVGYSWVTEAEESYLQLANFIRLSESKIHSTIRFEGGFCAYKRNAFDIFDCETGSDDSGTALKVVCNGYRAILIPEIVFHTSFPSSLFGKLKVKFRRANQLTGLWVKCFKLLYKKSPNFPKRIVIPEIILFIFSPLIFLTLTASGLALIIMNPFSPLSLAIIFSVLILLIFKRWFFIELLIDNVILAGALLTFLFGRRYIAWGKAD